MSNHKSAKKRRSSIKTTAAGGSDSGACSNQRAESAVSIPPLAIDPEALYTTPQVRRLLGNKSAVTMWRWGRAGKLGPIVRLNDRKHFYGRYIIGLVESGLQAG